jgi:hypothetical protein
MDDSAPAAAALFLRPPTPRIALLPRRRNPNNWEHSGRLGEKAAKSPTCNPATIAPPRVSGVDALKIEIGSGFRLSAPGDSLLASGSGFNITLARELLFYHYESAAYFVHHLREVYGQQGLLRIDHHIHAGSRRHSAEPDRLAQAPLHAVALHRTAQCTTDGEADTRTRRNRLRARLHGLDRRLRPRPVERRQTGGKMPPPQLIDALEIGVPQQPRAARKTAPASSRLGALIRLSSLRFSGHTDSHSDSEFPLRWYDSGSASPRHWTIRGNLVSPRPACAPWRDGGK